MEYVDHHGRTTAYRVWERGGGGVPLLCIHGSGGSHRVWTAQARLADDRPVVALDLSGHGDSDDVDADAGYETLSAYAADVIAVADETAAGVLVGHSLGGAVALSVALDRSFPLLDGLVLAGTGARLPVLDDLLVWLAEDFDRAVEFLHDRDRLFHDRDERYLDDSRRAMRAAGRAITERDFRTCHQFDVRDRLAEVAVPAVAIVGEHDRLTPRRLHEELASGIETCALAVLEDAAHLSMIEADDQFDLVVREFCDRFIDH